MAWAQDRSVATGSSPPSVVRSARFGFFDIVIPSILLIGAALAVIMSLSDEEPPPLTWSTSARLLQNDTDSRELDVEVVLSGDGHTLHVTNNGGENWHVHVCSLHTEYDPYRGDIPDSYKCELDKLPAGTTISIPLADFRNTRGDEPFDPTRHVPGGLMMIGLVEGHLAIMSSSPVLPLSFPVK
jgi:hypothetical protein